MPVTSVPTSFATVAIDTFMTELSRVMRNWPAARVIRTVLEALRGALVSGAMQPRRSGTRSLARRARDGRRIRRVRTAGFGWKFAACAGGALALLAGACSSGGEPRARVDVRSSTTLSEATGNDAGDD